MELLGFVPGPLEWTVIGIVGVLIFGNRLPKIARGVGSSFVEFKRGLKNGQDDLMETKKLASEIKSDIEEDVRGA